MMTSIVDRWRLYRARDGGEIILRQDCQRSYMFVKYKQVQQQDETRSSICIGKAETCRRGLIHNFGILHSMILKF